MVRLNLETHFKYEIVFWSSNTNTAAHRLQYFVIDTIGALKEMDRLVYEYRYINISYASYMDDIYAVVAMPTK